MKRQALFIFLTSIVLILIAFHFQQRLSHFRSLGLLGIFLINLFGSATIFLPAPAIASVFAGGIVYPPILVAFVSAIGSSLGELTGFFLGRSGEKVFLENEQHVVYKALVDLFKRYGGLVILITSFVPNPFFDIVGIMAGVFSYSSYRFLLFVTIGRLMRDILLAYAGSLF